MERYHIAILTHFTEPLIEERNEDAVDADEYERVQRENDRLHNEKRTLVQQRKEHGELVEYVQEERSLTRQKAQAGVFTRAKWWLFGMDDDSTTQDS